MPHNRSSSECAPVRRWLFTVGLAGSIEGYVPLAAEKEEAASMTSLHNPFAMNIQVAFSSFLSRFLLILFAR